jgi:predicted MFS family arabinose efflux permease
LVGDAAWSLYAVNETTVRQRVTAPEVLGRVNAAMQLATRGMIPIGALLGGALAQALGLPMMLWIATVMLFLASAWLWPVRAVTHG